MYQNKCFASFIVPVYNAEKWLAVCIESIINQTDSDFEIILIDDGSTDGSGNICDQFVQKDSRICVVHKANCGVSSARNDAIQLAKGRYILFVDADDVISPYLLESLKEAFYRTQADFYFWKLSRFDGEILFEKPSDLKIDSFDAKSALYKVLEPYGEIQGYACNKAFRRDKILEITFNRDIHINEDLLYVCQCIAGNIDQDNWCGIDERLYGYRRHTGNTGRKKFSPKSMSRTFVLNHILDVINGLDIEKKLKNQYAGFLKQEICYTNKKLLFSRMPEKNYFLKEIDEIWKKYRTVYDSESWSFRLRCYKILQGICYKVRQRNMHTK